MKKQLSKRVAGLIVAAALLAGSSPAAPAFAAETDGLEAAILLAKSLVNVPESMKDFNYYISENDDSGYTTYSLNWNDEDKGSVSAEVANDRLVSFNSYSRDDGSRGGLGSVNRDAALRTAKDFLATVDDTLAAKMEVTEDPRFVNTVRHSFNFVMKENGVPADFVTAQVGVDKHTGEVADYFWQGVADPPVLPAGKAAISEEEAKEAFLAANGVRLEYRAWYNRETKKRFVKLVYALKDNYLAIDAQTGEPINISGIIELRTANAEAAADSAGAGGAPQLTEAEISALEALGGLLTKDAAVSALARVFPEVRDIKLSFAGVNRDYADESRYIWNLNFDKSDADGASGGSASLDAKTGELLSWYYSVYSVNGQSDAAPSVPADKALETARAFIKEHVSAEKQARVRENTEQSDYYNTPDADGRVYVYNFAFDRYENDVPFRNNGITVGVDARTGKVTQYNCNWFENVAIQDAPNDEKGTGREHDLAFNLYDEHGDFGLKYAKVYTGDERDARGGEITLVWHWNAAAAGGVDFLIDAVSFARLGTDGKPYRDNVAAVSYDDIAGHWAEGVISKLLENGYYIPGESFRPKEKITQEDFLRYLYAPEQRYYDDADAFYKMLLNNGVIKEEERDPEAALTRYDAAKFVVRWLGQGRVAEHHEVFVNAFKDDAAAEYKGYVAIVKALSVMKGDAAGNFNGARALTRAEAAAVIAGAIEAR